MTQFISWSKSAYRYSSETIVLSDTEDLIIPTGLLAKHHSFVLDPLSATVGVAEIHVQYDGQGFYTNTGLTIDITDSDSYILSFVGQISNVKIVTTTNFDDEVVLSVNGSPAVDSSDDVAEIQERILPENWVVSNPGHKIYSGTLIVPLSAANNTLFNIEVPLNTAVTYEGIINAYDDTVEARWYRDRGLLVNNAGVITNIGVITGAGPTSVNGRTNGGGRFVVSYVQDGNSMSLVASSSNDLTVSKYSWYFTTVGG